MEPRQTISKKPFVSEEENNCEAELVILIGANANVSVN